MRIKGKMLGLLAMSSLFAIGNEPLMQSQVRNTGYGRSRIVQKTILTPKQKKARAKNNRGRKSRKINR